MPSLVRRQTNDLGRLPDSSYSKQSKRSSRMPPPEICAKINQQINSNPVHSRSDFDYAAHVQARTYTYNTLHFDGAHCATLLDEGVKNHLRGPFLRPPFQAKPNFEIDMADAKDHEKGLGMFATRDVAQGGIILTEYPVIVTPFVIGLSTPVERLYAALLEQLEPSLRRQVLSLANCTRDKEGFSELEGIMRTNALDIELPVADVPHPELSTHRALFLNTSRCNHSCGPNALWKWDTTSFTLTLEAVRPIHAGEEITIQYLDCTHTRDTRRAQLHALYNFTCECPHCHPPGLLLAQSDIARDKLRTFYANLPRFEDWCADAHAPDDLLIAAHQRALALRAREGLELFEYRRHVDAIAMCYGALRDVKMFRYWVTKARDSREQGNLEKAVVLDLWLEDPESFPVWGWRNEKAA